MLNPLTNSLSPSEKSKGERFNSVKKINTIKINIIKINKLNIFFILKHRFIFIKINIQKKNKISNEILWLLKRIKPKNGYFDFLKNLKNILK